MIKKSEQEYINLKNIQLKKLEVIRKEETKDDTPKINEVVA